MARREIPVDIRGLFGVDAQGLNSADVVRRVLELCGDPALDAIASSHGRSRGSKRALAGLVDLDEMPREHRIAPKQLPPPQKTCAL